MSPQTDDAFEIPRKGKRGHYTGGVRKEKCGRFTGGAAIEDGSSKYFEKDDIAEAPAKSTKAIIKAIEQWHKDRSEDEEAKLFPQFSFADFDQFVTDQDAGLCAGTCADSGKIEYEPYGTVHGILVSIQSDPHHIAEKFVATSFDLAPERGLIHPVSVWRSRVEICSCTVDIATPDGRSFKPDFMFREDGYKTVPYFIIEVFWKNGTREGNRDKLRERLHRFKGEIRGGVFFYYDRKTQCWLGEVWRYVNLRVTKEVNYPDVLDHIDGWDEQESIEVQVCEVNPKNPAERIGDHTSYLQENRPYQVWSMQGDAEDLLLTMADLFNNHYDEIVVDPSYRRPNATFWVLASDIAEWCQGKFPPPE